MTISKMYGTAVKIIHLIVSDICNAALEKRGITDYKSRIHFPEFAIAKPN